MPDPLPSKPWYKSQTMITLIIGVAAGALAYFTKNPQIEVAIEAESSNITAIISGLIALVSSVLAVLGRLKANTKLTK